MNSIKNTLREILPSFIWTSLSSLKKILKLNNSKSLFFLNRLDAKKSDCIYVLGNGPSLKNDISYLPKNKTYFCVNNFSTNKEYEILKPKYYLFLDDYFFSDNAHQDWINQRSKTFSDINNKTDWGMTIFYPSWVNQRTIKKHINNKHIKFVSLRIGEFNSSSKQINRLFFNTGLFGPSQVNVLIYAVYISIWLKTSKIIILGADTSFHNDFSVDQSTNQLFMDFRHFNDDTQKKPLMKNPEKINPFTIFEIMDTCTKTFQAHDMLEFFASTNSIKIYNASSFSLIDSYERLSLKNE
tara:strand:- start:4253 stop:5143 length:891 start_codon:yes stop_codon:yes gene_type:complete